MRKLLALALSLCVLATALPMLAFAEPLLAEPVTYTALIPSDVYRKVDPNQMALYLDRAARTNVNIEWTEVPATVVNERKATIFASGDYPDLYVNILNNSDVLTYGLAGALRSFNEYMTDETMPNLMHALAETPAAKGAITMPDGGVYGIPQINLYSTWPGDGVYIRTVQMINVDWLNTLGLEMPTTTDELLTVLRAFKDQDPNQNGLQDEIPYAFCYNEGHANNMGETVFGPFGLIGPSYYLNVRDGNVFYAIEDPAYVQAIQFARTMYEEGLMDVEAFTQDTARMYAKGNAETPVYGLVNGWTGDVEVGTARVGVSGTMYQPLPPVTGPEGVTVWKNEPAGINANRLNMSITAENPELIARWADLLYTEDESIQEIWGMYGICLSQQ
ncbi:MAG TPA: extracellular solute-binding protein, partial [Clostridia bacterium]|nr:extracellular solute-binding protein [Clostridia bacterium]